MTRAAAASCSLQGGALHVGQMQQRSGQQPTFTGPTQQPLQAAQSRLHTHQAPGGRHRRCHHDECNQPVLPIVHISHSVTR